MRICLVYDCLYPWTIGGAERWYRQMAEAHASTGHAVTYLTMRQWDPGDAPALPGIEVVAVGPRMALYADGRRRIAPPIRFGLGVFWHLLRHGRRYDVVHTASFPFFSLLAAGLVRPLHGFRIAVDWHEVWTRAYWGHYLGKLGAVGWAIQRLCARVPQIGFSFSRLHKARAEALGVRAVTLLEGEYAGGAIAAQPPSTPPFVLYTGRMIPEKRVPLLVDALALLMRDDPVLRAELIGRGPELDAVRQRVALHGLADRIELPGFVDTPYLADRQSTAAVLVQPSEREGYGMVVVESAARGVPVVVIAGEDNAAVELVEDGENGFVATRAEAAELAGAIRKAIASGDALRSRTRQWFAMNHSRLSFGASFQRILERLQLR